MNPLLKRFLLSTGCALLIFLFWCGVWPYITDAGTSVSSDVNQYAQVSEAAVQQILLSTLFAVITHQCIFWGLELIMHMRDTDESSKLYMQLTATLALFFIIISNRAMRRYFEWPSLYENPLDDYGIELPNILE